ANESYLPWSELELILNRLDNACHEFNHEAIREILLSAPTGFAPTDGICDLVWQQKQLTKPTDLKAKVVSLVS
ncbi:MAG: polysaccharide biosynthesis protein, partial [Shewanella sp.]